MRVALLAVAVIVLSGCASGHKANTAVDTGPGTPQAVTVTATTGGIRGVVVDQAIKPISGAVITLTGGKNGTSDIYGGFNFSGLDPGEYLISVGKPGYKAASTTTTVVANVAEPPIVKVLLEALSTVQPYQDIYKLDGSYDCASASFFDTDACDWPYGTVWDNYNKSHPSPTPPLPTPRSFFNLHNTQFIDVGADTFTIIQEGFWSSATVKNFWIMIDKTPIDPSCDCSDTYGNVIGPNPLYNRMDRYNADGSNHTEKYRADFVNSGQVDHFPAGETVASRGYLPFQKTPVVGSTNPNDWFALAQNFRFTVTTVLFHNQVPKDGWNFVADANS